MFSLLLHNSVCINVFTCTATDRYCCSITNRNYFERRAETEEKTINWQEWKFHNHLRVIFSAVGGTAVYL